MDQDNAPRTRSLDEFRSYLLLLVRMQLEPGPRNRIDPSDIVQQTLLEAHAKADPFHGDNRPWRRGCGRRWSITYTMPGGHCDVSAAIIAANRPCPRRWSKSSARLGEWPHSNPLPASGLYAMRTCCSWPTPCLQSPEPQREATVWHHLHGRSLSETASHLGSTDAALAGLLHRGLRKRRKIMGTDRRL
jgi:RNA polymerase sigma-70 factor (ECF subfamily)